MRKLGLVCLLAGFVMIVVAGVQCGGGTSTTNTPINSADGGNNTGPGPSGGW
jgi:hypothetical protein